MLKLFYMDGNTALIGQLADIRNNNSGTTLDKVMLIVIYYDRVPNKMRTGVDYLTSFSIQHLTGTNSPQTITIPDKYVAVDCTDERMQNIYEAAIKPPDNVVSFPEK